MFLDVVLDHNCDNGHCMLDYIQTDSYVFELGQFSRVFSPCGGVELLLLM